MEQTTAYDYGASVSRSDKINSNELLVAVNAGLILPNAKYEVSRAIDAKAAPRLLAA